MVVPTRQRAAAVRMAHTRLAVQSGRTAWVSCDVLPWSAWLERLADQARHGSLSGQRRLGVAEEWLLWREVAVEACAERDLLQPASLADALRRSHALQRDWGLRCSGTATSESEVLQQAGAIFARRCAALRAYSSSDWSRILVAAVLPPKSVLIAGFGLVGTELRERLRALGVQFASDGTTVPRSASPSPSVAVMACQDPAEEWRSAARWCRTLLEHNPAARLLVVATGLSGQRLEATQAFDHALVGRTMVEEHGAALFAIEGGQPLADFPIVSAALGLLELGGLGLGGTTVSFAELSALLRSPYVGCGTPGQRAALELLLRERNVHSADFATLLTLAQTPSRRHPEGGGALADATGSLATALESVANASIDSMDRGSQTDTAQRRDHAAGWARRFATLLEAGGWPGSAALRSDEQQQRDRFRDLLGDFAALGAGGTTLRYGDALELLRALAARTAYESASGDVPVTVTDSIEDPLIHYDGIWVAGMNAERWPPAPMPDPFIPIAVQRQAGIVPASPQGQLGAAQEAMAAWRGCAGTMVWSWPQFDGEVPLQPSHLVAAASPATAMPAPADLLVVALHRSAGLELRVPDRALACAPGGALVGGTRALQLQSHCPFRAAAQLRLGAVPVAEPTPGLTRRERGQIMHRALEAVWRVLGSSRELRRRQGSLGATVAPACAQAMAEQLRLRAVPVAPALIDNELHRLERMITLFLEQELQRAEVAEFTVQSLEESQDRDLSGVPLRVRMDRVDRLDDGRVLVIDYKSGAAETFRPLDERPRQPQLLAYALLVAGSAEPGSVAGSVAGVAAVHLNADVIRWRGASAEPSVLPGLATRVARANTHARVPTAPWAELIPHWRRVIERLVRSFMAGDASVDPLPGACRHCHLPMLCRVSVGRLHQPNTDTEEIIHDP